MKNTLIIIELGLLKDIERLIKREIPKEVIDGFEPDPTIKAEPINRGRGKQQQGSGKRSGKKPGNRGKKKKAASGNSASSSPWNKRTPNKAPKRGSVRCAHSAGRAEDARPLARRYVYKKQK